MQNKQKFNRFFRIAFDAIQERNKGTLEYAARMTDDGRIVNAEPREMCQKIMRAYGIKRAYYTIDDESFGTMRVTP